MSSFLRKLERRGVRTIEYLRLGNLTFREASLRLSTLVAESAGCQTLPERLLGPYSKIIPIYWTQRPRFHGRLVGESILAGAGEGIICVPQLSEYPESPQKTPCFHDQAAPTRVIVQGTEIAIRQECPP